MRALDILYTMFFISLPQCLTFLIFSFVVWGDSFKKHRMHVLLFCMMHSAFTAVSLAFGNAHWHAVIFFASYILLFALVFQDSNWSFRIKHLTLSLFSYVCGGMLMALTYFIFEPAARLKDLLQPPAEFYWPIISAVALIIFIMHKKQWHPGQTVFHYVQKTYRSKFLICLFVFLFMQFLITYIFLSVIVQLEQAVPLTYILLCLAVIVGIMIFMFSIKLMSSNREDAIRKTQELYIEDIKRLFTTIRGQRHDFLNHVQVIQSYMKMGKMSAAQNYMEELVGEIKEIDEIIKVGHPALSALIQAKTVDAVSRKILFQYHFEGFDQLPLGIKSIDIIKIAANLIDNAFDEVEKLPAELRWVEVESGIDNKKLYLTVKNPGRTIPDNKKALLFTPGYTSKQSHTGLGLAIVKERVDFYNGVVSVEDLPGSGATFRVSIPI